VSAWRWLALGLLVLGGSLCQGASPYQPVYGDPMREPWRWRTFADLSGLDAQCMTEAADGTIWFGTAAGLCSFDGFEWNRHQEDAVPGNDIPCDGVSALCSNPDGTLDAGGWWGISRFRQGKWTRLIPAMGLRFADVRRLASGADGSLWAATSWGALHQQPTGWTLYTSAGTATWLRQDPQYAFLHIELLPETVLAKSRNDALAPNRHDLTEVVADRQGRIWFGTKGGEILCHTPAPAPATPGTWVLYNETDGLVGGRSPSILPLQDGTIWVAPASSGQINVFDGQAWRTLPLPAPGVAPDGARLLQTRDGVVWLSARYVLFAFRDGQWRTYQKPEVPVPNALNLLLQSADGALWIAGPNTDIQRVDYQTPRWSTLKDLNFQWESPAGAQWFLHRDGRVVVHADGRWTSYGTEDGLIDAPVALLGTRRGEVWAAGSHDHTAATAQFDGTKWTRHLHDNFSWSIDARAVFESADGSVWFGAAVDSSGPPQHRDGILQFRDGVWTHHHQPGRSPRDDGAENPATLLPASHRPEPIEKYSCLGESRDGKIWAGRNVLVFHDGRKWHELFPPPGTRLGIIESMLTTREGDLWLGTRQYGALRYDGREWRGFQGKDSLVANSVRSLTQTADGSVWAATDRGISRFDGRTWMAEVLPAALLIPHDGGGLKAAASGPLWLNRHTVDWHRRAWTKAPPAAPDAEFWTLCHQFQGPPPHTRITAGVEKVSQPGNISILWSGAVPWREPQEARLQFSFRLDDQPWSAFTADASHAFFTLPAGRHHFEVRARDQDFNIDPTPATLDFVVLPPVWRQGWFILLMIVLGGLIATQTVRVLLEQGRLRKAQTELEERVRQRTAELELANRELEAFSYSVSHDLRAPLRGVDGFSQALQEDYAGKLDAEGQDYLRRIRAGAQHMGRLIEALLGLSRVTRGTLQLAPVNLSHLAVEIAAELARREPTAKVEVIVAPDLVAAGDSPLLRVALENLLGNAWKFTSRRTDARIEFGVTEQDGLRVYFVRDNGAGFDMTHAQKLFGAFQRFHTAEEFPGTGIGLATVQRIIHRHGGRIWAESQPGHGATFYFTLPEPPPHASSV
jgi:signal transduction histidine kinase/ligand-binding sensor domain-containing protein